MSPTESPSSSPSSSSGSDDFAAFLASELELASDADSSFPGDPSSAFPATGDECENEDEPVELEVEAIEQNGPLPLPLIWAYIWLVLKHLQWIEILYYESDCCRVHAKCSTKRRRVEEQCQDQGTSARPDKMPTGASKNVQVEACPHPGYINGLCYTCGNPQDEEDVSGVALDYVHKGLRLCTSEIERLRGADLKNLLRERKLVLILDLDHTLINSTSLEDISSAEKDLGIQTAASKDDPNRSIFALEPMQMLTKLRPFVREFLKEASNMFDMHIYTMGHKAYAIEVAKLLDPSNIYFPSKVISNSDCTQPHQKGLDVILGAGSVAVILDDTEYVWKKHKENLIRMERYHFFASSCRQFGIGVRSLSESMRDERESDGALATVLDVLKRIHAMFFDMAVETDLSSRDVRQVIKAIRKEILQGCKIVFSQVTGPQRRRFRKMAEHMGAVCSTNVDSSVTHVVTVGLGTEKARWGVDNKKFLVHPRWIEAANFRWHRQLEEEFLVTAPKEKSRKKGNAVACKKGASKGKENAEAGQKELRKRGRTEENEKRTRNDERNVAGQEKDGAKENAVADKKETSKGKENAEAGQKELRKRGRTKKKMGRERGTRSDETDVAGQEKDDAKENAVATSTTGPADS